MRKTFAAILALCYLCYFNIAHTEIIHQEIKPPKKLTMVEKQQVECLAQNIYYEAGYEPIEGQIAVALVTLNRVYSGLYPKSICATMTQKFEEVCQFSWYCDDYKRVKAESYRYTKREKEVFANVRSIALHAYLNYNDMHPLGMQSLLPETRGYLI